MTEMLGAISEIIGNCALITSQNLLNHSFMKLKSATQAAILKSKVKQSNETLI